MVRQAHQLLPELHKLAGIPASQAAALLEDNPPLVIYCLYLKTEDKEIRAVLEDYVVSWRWVKASVDGKMLKDMGVSIGPRIGDILDELKAAWIDQKITTPAEEIQYLKDILETGTRSS